MRISFIGSIAVLLLLLGCNAPQEDNNKLYNDVVGQLFRDMICFENWEDENRFQKKLLSKRNTQEREQQMLDSVRNKVLRAGQLCVVDYRDTIISSFNELQEFMMRSGIHNHTFIRRHFAKDSILAIISSMSKPSGLTESDFVNPMVKISPYKASGRSIYVNDNSVLSLSKAWRNKTNTRALLYYEYVCGGKCGRSALLFLANIDDRWQIIHREDFWSI